MPTDKHAARAAKRIAVGAHRIYGQRDNRETEGFDGALAEFGADVIAEECPTEALRAENEKLVKRITGRAERRKKLESEVARLREALERICEPRMEICACRCRRCIDETEQGRAALAEKEK